MTEHWTRTEALDGLSAIGSPIGYCGVCRGCGWVGPRRADRAAAVDDTLAHGGEVMAADDAARFLSASWTAAERTARRDAR